MNEHKLKRNPFSLLMSVGNYENIIHKLEKFRMKKSFLFLSVVIFALLFVFSNADAQIRTARGDFFNITRTVEQTADSVTFIADTLKVYDTAGLVADFQPNDSVCVMFVQNRFKIVNNKLAGGNFDYIIAATTLPTGMSLARQAVGTDPAQAGNIIGLKPVYRPVGNIASTSTFNQGPSAIRQVLTFRMVNPTNGRDGWGLRRIYFKPNINNLTGLAIPPDTTKDTLRAYLLDAPTGNVVNYTDLAIVRLLPGTTQILMWVNDSAQSVDAGEYIGSFGDYSRGRYFLGDDGLPLATSVTPEFRPTNVSPITGGPNPDEGLVIDGFPPEPNPIRQSNVYFALAPGGTGVVGGGYNCSPPNPQYGLIPPYRVGEYAVAHTPYQPGLVTSGVDTLRFLDCWGNRTWDLVTQPRLRAIQWNMNASGWGTALDRTNFLRGHADRDDTLRQVGQIVYRRLSYVHADLDPNVGQPSDSIQIIATATIFYKGQGGIPKTMGAYQDTSGGYPRYWTNQIRTKESNTDDMARTMGLDDNGHDGTVRFEPNREPVDPAGMYFGPFLPPDGLKIIVRPNIPRRTLILPKNILTNAIVTQVLPGDHIKLEMTVTDAWGNSVDDNERFKFEISPWSPRLGGIFDSAGHYAGAGVFLLGPGPYHAGPDSGRVAIVSGAGFGTTTRQFQVATGSHNLGQYRIRARASYALNDRFNDLSDPLKRDPNPGPGFNHVPDIPDGSPNNNFGVVFGPGAVGCGASGFGNRMGQTVAIDSIEVGPKVILTNRFLELVHADETFIVNRYGNRVKDPINTLYARATDVWNNPVDLDLADLELSIPDNPVGMNGDKDFRASVSPNVAEGGLGGVNCPEPTFKYDAVQVQVNAGGILPGILGDYPAAVGYQAVRFFFLAPKNLAHLGILGAEEIKVIGKLKSSFGARGNSAIMIKVVPDVVQTVEVFKSYGKPQGSTEPVPWIGGSTVDRERAWYPTGTPQNAAETQELYTGYFFRASDGTVEAQTGTIFPTPEEPGATIGSFGAKGLGGDDDDATTPIPMDTITVSKHDKQIRIMARLLDQYRNPVGGRLVKFWTLGNTIPVTPPRTVVQDNAQRGGFGEFGAVNVSDDTLKRSTVGDTAQSGWVSAYFNSGRVGHQIVRIALTPDTLAFDIAPGVGDDLGEGTAVGPSRRGYAPRVIIPIYQKSDTVVRVELYPYTASVTSPIPLPHDPITMQRYEHNQLYDYPCPTPPCKDAPSYQAFSSVANRTEIRRVVAGRFTGADIRPYIPDTLNLTATTGPNAITAGRIVSILAREYDQFGNLVDYTPLGYDTARVRFRMWGDGWTDPPSPYHINASDPAAGTVAPTARWTKDEWGPMRKARYRHTQVGNLVAGIHINQTAFMVGLEYPTPKLADATVYFECTATGVLPPSIGVAPDIDRDTVKIVSVVKNPTRFDVLRAGQDWAVSQSAVGTVDLVTSVNTYTGLDDIRTQGATIVGLPVGADPIQHSTDAWSVDNILVSQAYARNVSQELVGLYEVVNNDNVPLDKKGNAMFLANGSLNPAFEGLVKLPAFNNQNPSFNPFYNLLNNPALQQRVLNTTVPNTRDDGTVFDVTIAGGGDGIGANINVGPDSYDSRRYIAFRITPVWENTPPTGPASLTVEGRTYGRLYADSIYTYGGRVDANAEGARGEFMGTRTDRGDLAAYKPSGEKDRITRMITGLWGNALFNNAGFPGMTATGATSRVNPNPLPNSPPFISAPIRGTGGTFNRRQMDLAKGFTRGYLAPGYIAPGAFVGVVDSTTEQVVDLRVYDKSLVDGAGNGVDDTVSYDQGKKSIIRSYNNGLRHYGDTYFTGVTGIPGPNYNVGNATDTRFPTPNELPASSGLEPLQTRQFPGVIFPNPVRHTFVVIPYRIAFTSIFPSSYDVSQNLHDLTRLPLGILPRQVDIDTLPRVTLIPPPGADLTKFELWTRLYGQIQHGATAQIPLTNPNEVAPYNATPYARPDTVYRDIIYTYALTPYDRYGNLNVRDTLFVNVGGRFSDWDFLDLGTGAGANLTLRAGGQFFRAIPRNTPTNEQYRMDTLRIFNPRGVSGSNRNDFLGIKPDDDELSLTVGRAKPPFGTGVAVYVPHGLLAANIIASRPVNVKKPFAPAPFVLSTATIKNTDLFRIDYTGCNVPNEYAKDTLRMRWQTSVYPPNSGMNNPNDTVRYYWHALIDSVYTGGGTTNPLDVRFKADNDGISPALTIDGLTLRNLLFRPGVAPQPNGGDSLVMRVRWYVEAINKVGMITYSDTAGGTIRQYSPSAPFTPPLVVSINRRPVCASGLAPKDNYPTAINATSTINAQWNPGTDMNITKGKLISAFKTFDQNSQKWVDVVGREVDTLTYQWRGVVRRTFPVGKGAPIGYQVIVPAGVNATGVTIPSSVLDDLFRGFSTDPTSTSADSVILDWYVDVKDFNFTNGKEAVTFDSAWSGVGCRPHICTAGPTRLNLTKLESGGVEIDPSATAVDINKLTGEKSCFTLTAKDKNGNIIRDWNVKGSDVTLKLANSTANSDSSDAGHTMQNGDPNSFTEAWIEDKNGVRLTLGTGQLYEWKLPKDLFVDGVTTICFTTTKAESLLTITATPAASTGKNVSAKMNYGSNGITNYLVTVTGQSPAGVNGNQVYVYRRYEIIVYPRDKYSNFSNQEIITRFSARFPGEFDNTSLGSADIFAGDNFIKGPTNYFVLSTTKREKPVDQVQWIMAYKRDDNNVRGTTDPYEILTHAPQKFDLQQPADQTTIRLQKAADITTFTWTKAVDPYTNIKISKFDPPTAVFSDKVSYMHKIYDQNLAAFKAFVSDGAGALEKLTLNHGQLFGVVNDLSGNPTTKQIDAVWRVEATDGLFTTLSTPPNQDPQNRPGYRLTIIKEGILDVPTPSVPTAYSLDQNFPNPFNPSTEITFALPKATRVHLVVFDLLGQPIKTLVNDWKEAGVYKVTWDATNDLGNAVPTGNYVYKVVAGSFTATRKMTLLK